MKSSTIWMLLTTALVAVGAKKTVRPSCEFTFNSTNAYTVAIDTNLYTVSYYDTKLTAEPPEKRQVYLNLTSSDKDYKHCKILLNPQSETILGRIKAAAVWHKIVVWGVRNRTEYENLNLMNYTFLLVDPRTCTHLTLPNLGDTHFWEPKVVVHLDRLDIFNENQTARSRCSFDLNGNKIEAKQLLHRQESSRVMAWQVRAIGKSYDYIIVYSVLDERPTKLILYDRDFRLKSSAWLETNVETVAHSSVENETYVAVVSYRTSNFQKQRNYTVFDQNLKVVFEAYPPLLDGYLLSRTFAHIDSAGNSCLILMQDEGQHRKFTMVRYDINGRLIDEAVIGPTIDIGGRASYEVQVLLIGEREYCLVIHTTVGFTNETESTNITCIEVVGKY